WIDKTSEEFLNYLIGWLAHAKVLLVILYRPEYTHQWSSKSFYNHIGLTQLTTQSSAQLVQAILEGSEVVPELRELILSRTSGNPLFMEELTHTLLENGTIQRRNHEYVLNRKASDIQVPDTIQGIIAARLDRLEDNLKRTMQVASVIGRDFAFRILQTITGMREELKSHLLNLQGLELIYEKSLFPELEYIFKHALIQEVAYNSLLLKRRKEIHEKIGRAIEQIYSERLEEFYEMLAYHYSRSENAEKAYQYLKLAGEKATGNYANWESFRFYKGAIEILNSLPKTDKIKKEHINTTLLILIPMRLLGFPEDSLEILKEGERLSRELQDEKSIAMLLATIALCYVVQGKRIEALRYAENCFKEARKIHDINLMAPIAYDLCLSYTLSGEFLKLIDVAPKTITLIEIERKESEFFGKAANIYSVLQSSYGLTVGIIGDFNTGKHILNKALYAAQEVNHLYTIGAVEYNFGFFFLIQGEGKGAVQHFLNSIKYLEEAQGMIFLGLAWSGLGTGYYLLGDLIKALTIVEKGFEIQRGAKISSYLSVHHFFLL
ncbi:MAG: guanylate cyclase, partial [Candidatus Hodarchaeota archaeon]